MQVSRWPAWLIGSLTATLLCAGNAQAGLFDDEEARKAIVDLRARIVAMEEIGRASCRERVCLAV